MFTSSRKHKKLLVPFRPRLEILEDRTLLSVCTVDRLTDMGQGSGPMGDLRYCIMQAQEGDRIAFQVSGTINLTRALPDLSRSISIGGPGPDLMNVRRDTGGNYRIFTVTSGTMVSIDGLTIANGYAYGGSGGGISNAGTLTVINSNFSGNSTDGAGGGISNTGRLKLGHSMFSGNFADSGGGIENLGRLSITNSTFSGNSSIFGGGIQNGDTLTIISSTFSGNSATDGGGIDNSGTLGITNSTLSGNTATTGGGIENFLGTVTVTSSTLSGNRAPYGGGIHSTGTVTVTSSTISGNSALDGAGGGLESVFGSLTITSSTVSGNAASYEGGGIYNVSGPLSISSSTLSGNSVSNTLGFSAIGGGIVNGQGRLSITSSTLSGNTAATAGGGIYTDVSQGITAAKNTVIAGNTAPGSPDLFGPLTSQGHNLIGDGTGASGFIASDLVGTDANPIDARLGLLADNGGPTQTMALLPSSPAVDAGDNNGAPMWDQRGEGFPRIVGGTIDIGAFEAQIGSATSFRIDAPNSVLPGMPFDVTVTALDAYNHLATGYTGTVTFSTTDTGKGVVLPADYTFTPDDSGFHIFTDTGLGETTLITPGDQTITVRDTTDDTIMGSATVTVTGGNGPRMGGGNLGGDFNLMGSAFGSPIHRKGSANSENFYFIDKVWNLS